MHIGIVGAGSIGCFVGGRLLAAGVPTTLVGRPRLRDEIAEHGLTVIDFGERLHLQPADVRYETQTACLADCDAVLVCLKSAQTQEVAAELATTLRGDAVVASLQNGVRNPDTLREALGARTVLAGIVEFNVVSKDRGVFQRGTDGGLIVERGSEPLAHALRGAGIEVRQVDAIAPAQWSKLLINLNNAVVALTDAPTPMLLSDPCLRRVVAAILEEAAFVLKAAAIPTASLRGLPVGWMPRILRLPSPLVRLVTRAQMKVDPAARSSMWEDLQRGRQTEIAFLNGEVVLVAEAAGVDAPINRRLVALIHEAEAAGAGSPGLAPQALADALGVTA